MSGAPGAFLDRDGVLNELVPDPASGAPESPLRVEDVRLIDGAAAAARELCGAGFELVCVSNQPAAAKDKVTVERLCAIHARVIELLALAGAHLRASRVCLHHPEGVVPELSGACNCRKPAPGMLLEAASTLALDLGASWMIGDTDADVGAGCAAGCQTVLIEHPGTHHKRSGDAIADVVASDLNDAVTQLLGAQAGDAA